MSRAMDVDGHSTTRQPQGPDLLRVQREDPALVLGQAVAERDSGSPPMTRKTPARPGVEGPVLILHTIKQVAARLAVSLRTVRRLIAPGALPVHRIGRAVRVSEDDLARFLAARRHA